MGNHGATNLGTLGVRFGGIDAATTVSSEAYGAAIRAASAKGVAPISKTESILVRLPISDDLPCYLALEDYDPRDVASLSSAEAGDRKQAQAYLEILRTLPGCAGAYLASTGPDFGTRESRQINSVEQLIWQHICEGRAATDSVALGAWGSEWHNRQTLKSEFIAPPDGSAYGIPLACLTSRDTANLFAAGRTADGDQKAGASLRVMGTAFATGQAAGVAAAHYADLGRVDADAVRSTLRGQGAIVDLDGLAAMPLVRTLDPQ